VPPAELDPEDAKLVTLARSSRARAGAAQGAAVRDGTGRTYTAADVDLPSLRLTALEAAVAAAASSGVRTLEAAAVVLDLADDGSPAGSRDRSVDDLGEALVAGVAVVRDLGGTGTPVLVAGTDGVVRATLLA
jgi:hypothetical protein